MTHGLRFSALAALFAAALAAQRPTPREYRGTNYFPSTTLGMCNALDLLTASSGATFEGAYNPTQTRAEIATIAKAGLNCVRIFPSFYGWLAKPADYMNNLRDFARACRERNIYVTYVMWNTISSCSVPVFHLVDPNPLPIPHGAYYDASLHWYLQAAAGLYTLTSPPSPAPFPVVTQLGEPWQFALFDEPGNALFEAPYHGIMASWPNHLRQKAEAYIDAIGEFFAIDPDGRTVYASYDLFNEPDCCSTLPLATQLELMSVTYKRLARKHAVVGAPRPEFTVGFAQFAQTRQAHDALVVAGIKQSYLSYHCYEPQPLFDQVAVSNAQVGQQLAMSVVCSEFYDKNRPGHLNGLTSMIATLEANSIGGQVWGYLATNLIIPHPAGSSGNYARFDGIVIPSAMPVQSFTGPLFFLLAPGADNDARAIKDW